MNKRTSLRQGIFELLLIHLFVISFGVNAILSHPAIAGLYVVFLIGSLLSIGAGMDTSFGPIQWWHLVGISHILISLAFLLLLVVVEPWDSHQSLYPAPVLIGGLVIAILLSISTGIDIVLRKGLIVDVED